MLLNLPAMLLFFVGFVAVSQAYNSYNHYSTSYLSRCADAKKPCRLDLGFENEAGDLISGSDAELCSCNYPTTCPTDWNMTDHVIARNLISSTFRTTLKMMFCDSVVPQRTCQNGETSVILSGYLEIPNELELYNCTCQDGVPLQLNRRWRTPNFKYMHEYVCDDQKPTCSISVQPCVTLEGTESSYACKCPGRTQCHSPHAPWGRLSEAKLYGYCGPMRPPRGQ